MFCSYVWSNPNHSELLTGSVCDLLPNLHCLLCYFLICHQEYQYLNSFKGQELETTFSLFSVYFRVGEITLLGSFSQKRGKQPAPAECAERAVSSFSAAHERALCCGSSLRACELWANDEPAPYAVAGSGYFFIGDLTLDSFWGMEGSHHWRWDRKPSLV